VTVAALQGATPDERRSSLFLLDSSHGGEVGRVQVLPDVPTNDPRTAKVVDDVTRAAQALRRQGRMDAGVGGSAGELVDYDRAMKDSLPLIILGISLVTYVMLVPILRSLVLPAIAVLLNLVTVAVGFGVLTLLFVGKHPLLGGAGALDVISLAGMFSITFSLSIDYQVFLLSRMREGLVRTQNADAAIAFGIDKTARVVTGAAAIMVSVFVAFALSNFSIIRQFGVGLATAVIVDATVVRLALLPALMRLFGMRVWWLPVWLEERLPVLDVDGGEFEQETRQIRPAT
jgi:RND superfamily putative drug exporter